MRADRERCDLPAGQAWGRRQTRQRVVAARESGDKIAAMVRILPMVAEHIDAARTLWAESDGVEVAEGDSPADVARYLERNPAMSTVAIDDRGRLVAAVLCGHDGRRGYVYHLAVAKTHRGQGLGRALMRRSLAELKVAGISRALLLVAQDNASGREFWLHEGWEEMPFAKPMGLDL